MKTLPRLFLLAFWLLGFLASDGLAQPFPQVIWERNGAGPSSRYGAAIYALGDQNSDGHADFAVYAWGSGAPGQPSQELCEFFHGGNPPAAQPYRQFLANPDSGDRVVVYTVGDVNGDHYIDWVRREVSPTNPLRTVRVCRGGLSYDSTLAVFHVPVSISIEGVGDFNGDGYDDLYRYDWNLDYGEVLFGGPVLDTVPDWTRHSPSGLPQQALPDSWGDVNGDGYDDILSSLNFIFWGGAYPDTVPQALPSLGAFRSVVNDLNGDGKADLVSDGAGCYEVRWGGSTISAQPDLLLTTACQGATSDWQAVGVGDINHDGWGDLVVSEEFCDNDYFGSASLYLGCPWMSTAPAYTFWGFSGPADIIGHREAAGLGDVNGDGVDDFALGGYDESNQGLPGRAVVVAGDSNLRVGTGDLPPALPQQFSLSVYPNPFNSTATISLAVPKSEMASVRVYDVTGRVVRTVFEGRMEAGERRILLDAGGMASGVYFVRAEMGGRGVVEKVMLLK